VTDVGLVRKINLATNSIVKTIQIAPDAASHGVSFGIDGKLVVITSTAANTIAFIDTTTDEIVDSVRVAAAPEGIAFKRSYTNGVNI